MVSRREKLHVAKCAIRVHRDAWHLLSGYKIELWLLTTDMTLWYCTHLSFFLYIHLSVCLSLCLSLSLSLSIFCHRIYFMTIESKIPKRAHIYLYCNNGRYKTITGYILSLFFPSFPWHFCWIEKIMYTISGEKCKQFDSGVIIFSNLNPAYGAVGWIIAQWQIKVSLKQIRTTIERLPDKVLVVP